MHDFSTLRELLVILGSLTVVATAFHYLRIPTLVGFIITGVLIGPFGLAFIESIPNAQIITEIAVILLMFTIGLEFSFTKLKSLKKLFFGLGGNQVILTTISVGFLVHLILEYSIEKSIFIGALIAFSSTAVLLKLLEENRQTASPVGSQCIATLLFQDLAVIPVMLAIPIIAGDTNLTESVSINTESIYSFAIKIAAVGLTIFGGSRYIIPFVTSRILRTRSQELFFFFVLFLCLGSAYVMGEIGVSLSLGAFVAGVMISGSDYGKQVVSDFVPLRDNFLGLLFCSVGMLLNLDFIWENISSVILLCTSIFVMKIFIVFLILKTMRFSSSQSWTTGLCLFQIGELSLVLAQAGSEAGILSADEMQYILSVSITSMIFTPFIFKYAIKNESNLGILNFKTLIRRSQEKITEENKITKDEIHSNESFIKPVDQKFDFRNAWKRGNHTIVIGFGVAGKNVIETLKATEIPFTIIEANYDNYKKLRDDQLPVTFGDATKSKILNSADLDQAKLVVLTVSSSTATQNILLAIRKIRPDVKIIVRVQYLKELDNLAQVEQTDVVVAELETSYELVARTLKVYGAPLEQISQFINHSKRDWQDMFSDYTVSHRKSIELPAWEAMAHMRPYHLKKDHYACGKTIFDLNIRSHFQVSVVTVFRKDLGTTLPTPNLELQNDDILQLIGNDEQLEQAYYFLNSGKFHTPKSQLPT